MDKKTMTSMLLLGLLLISPASAVLRLDNIYYEPAVVAAGDEVDVVVEFHAVFSTAEEDKMNNPDYSYRVRLEPDDTLTERYVIVQDAYGDEMHGSVYSGDHYNKKFRVKVAQDAPAGTYEFKLTGRWYQGEEPVEGESYLRFELPVKKEGIVLGIGSITTEPAEVRPGDDYVLVRAMVENSGEKAAKAIELSLNPPEGLQASYTNNNRVWVGLVEAGARQEATFYLDVADGLAPAAYDLRFTADYMDLDNNNYQKTMVIPFLVKPRPHLEVVDVEGEGLAGGSGELRVTVKNTGSEDAESVDVRLIKQSAQPFTTDVRSDYLGVIAPQETAVAVFTLDVMKGAAIKEHDIKLLLRAKGDSDSGDDNIYTYSRSAPFVVSGKVANVPLIAGLAGLLFLGVAVIVVAVRRR